MILQLNPTIDCATPLGSGTAILVIDYGLDVNTVWVVRFDGGEIKHFYSDDIRIYDNPMQALLPDIKVGFLSADNMLWKLDGNGLFIGKPAKQTKDLRIVWIDED